MANLFVASEDRSAFTRRLDNEEERPYGWKSTSQKIYPRTENKFAYFFTCGPAAAAA